MDERCTILIVMGKTNPDADAHHQQSMVLVPIDTPGVTVERNLQVFGYVDQHGHAEVSFKNVRVPVSNLVGPEGEGFALAQARLGPGRIHHCMRAIGMAERALSLMIKRTMVREAFGSALVKQGVIQEWIATARIEIEQARLLVLKAAWMIDTVGAKGARKEIAAIKVAVPQMAQRVIDHAIQSYGGAGVSQDSPLAAMYAGIRTLRIVDGPDEVHIRDIARLEIKPYLA
jgi:acyl-CoA dehydrogenase